MFCRPSCLEKRASEAVCRKRDIWDNFTKRLEFRTKRGGA
jgi:hypothetical protein